MMGGSLDRRIALQRGSVSNSDTGEQEHTWATLATRWARKLPVSGVERFGTEQLEAREQVEFRIRWSTDLADLQPTDRVIEPAADATNPPNRSIYDIIAVLELGRHEGIRLITARRPVEP